MMVATASPRARRAYTRDEETGSDDLDPRFLSDFHQHWQEIEEQMNVLQDQKKAMMAAVRSKFGRHKAEAVKRAMQFMAMDELKRAENFHFNETARRYVQILQEEDMRNAAH